MRLSVPGYGQEPTEEEILRDIENLELDEAEPFAFDSKNPVDLGMNTWGEPSPGMAALIIGADFPTLQKRYNEFIGKRSTGGFQQSQLNDDGRKVYKKWAEFVGKRYQQTLPHEHKLPKRYMEFLGKRSDDRDHIKSEKRYSEFLG